MELSSVKSIFDRLCSSEVVKHPWFVNYSEYGCGPCWLKFAYSCDERLVPLTLYISEKDNILSIDYSKVNQSINLEGTKSSIKFSIKDHFSPDDLLKQIRRLLKSTDVLAIYDKSEAENAREASDKAASEKAIELFRNSGFEVADLRSGSSYVTGLDRISVTVSSGRIDVRYSQFFSNPMEAINIVKAMQLFSK